MMALQYVQLQMDRGEADVGFSSNKVVQKKKQSLRDKQVSRPREHKFGMGGR